QAPPLKPTGTTSVNLPAVPGATTWHVTYPYESRTTQTQSASIEIAPGRTTIPVIAYASAGDKVTAVYGDRAAPVAASGIDLKQSLTTQPVHVRLDHAPADSGSIGGALMIGDEGLSLPSGSASDLVVPTGIADAVIIAGQAQSAGELVITSVASKQVP